MFERGLVRKAKAALNEALTSAGFYNASDPEMSTEVRLAYEQRTSGHWHNGMHITNHGRDDIDAEGHPIVEGMILATYRGGRLFVGYAVYNLNNSWRLVHGDDVAYAANFEIFKMRPDMPRRFFSSDNARNRISRLLAKSIKQEDFLRAHVLRRARDNVAAADANPRTLRELLQRVPA